MATRSQRSVLFDVVDDHLVRTVILPDGRRYVQRCTRATFEVATHAIEEHHAQGVTLDELVKAMGASHTQVTIALDFLQEHGCLEIRHRRSYAVSGCLHEDAMSQYLYLAEAPY